MVAKSSKYFEALLASNFKEANEKRILLKNVDGPTLKKIIRYIYIGQVDITGDNVESLLAAASSMELISLEEKCEQFLEERLDDENCLQNLIFADRYNLLKLKAIAFKSVCENFEKISTDDMLHLGAEIFVELIKSDGIRASETQIFNRVVKWVQKDEVVRAVFAPDLLKSIRLDCLPEQVSLRSILPQLQTDGHLFVFYSLWEQ